MELWIDKTRDIFRVSLGLEGGLRLYIYDFAKQVAAQRAAGGGEIVSMSSFVKKEDLCVINAEVVFTKFLMDKNLPLAIADDAGDFIPQNVPQEISELYPFLWNLPHFEVLLYTFSPDGIGSSVF